jgi:hypothetical protein
MTFVLRRFFDVLHAGGLPLLVVLALGVVAVLLAIVCLFRRSRALSAVAAVIAGATALSAIAGSALNWYALRSIERELMTDSPFAGRFPRGALVSVGLPDPSLPISYGAVIIGLWLLLRLAARRRAMD